MNLYDSCGLLRNALRWFALVALPIALVLSGCAQDVGLLDRAQPGALKTSLFAGEW